MEIQELTVAEEKQKVVRQILEELPEWFGIAEAREEYIAQSAGQPCFAAMEQGKPIGFLCLKETGRDTMELADGSGPKVPLPRLWPSAFCGSKEVCGPNRVFFFAGKNSADGALQRI